MHSETQSDAIGRRSSRVPSPHEGVHQHAVRDAIRRHQTPSEPIRRTQMHAITLSRATVSSERARCSSA